MTFIGYIQFYYHQDYLLQVFADKNTMEIIPLFQGRRLKTYDGLDVKYYIPVSPLKAARDQAKDYTLEWAMIDVWEKLQSGKFIK